MYEHAKSSLSPKCCQWSFCQGTKQGAPSQVTTILPAQSSLTRFTTKYRVSFCKKLFSPASPPGLQVPEGVLHCEGEGHVSNTITPWGHITQCQIHHGDVESSMTTLGYHNIVEQHTFQRGVFRTWSDRVRLQCRGGIPCCL